MKKNHTNEFFSSYAAPEVNTNDFSFSCDIYSLGKVINYIINDGKTNKEIIDFNKYIELSTMCKDCIKDNPRERPTIRSLIYKFYDLYQPQLKIENLQEIFDLNENKIIQNTQLMLGAMYANDKGNHFDINKSIFFLTKSAEQNNAQAQLFLGDFYYNSPYIMKDINKAIRYLTLAANQNITKANYILGRIYNELNEINKSLHHLK